MTIIKEFANVRRKIRLKYRYAEIIGDFRVTFLLLYLLYIFYILLPKMTILYYQEKIFIYKNDLDIQCCYI